VSACEREGVSAFGVIASSASNEAIHLRLFGNGSLRRRYEEN